MMHRHPPLAGNLDTGPGHRMVDQNPVCSETIREDLFEGLHYHESVFRGDLSQRFMGA